MKYRADIEGLRAVAVIPVILFHMNLSFMQGGFVGVDIFFVISGYVIAHSLQNDLQNNSFSILKFYAKRIRRIFPALFATILATWLTALVIFLPNFFENLSKSTIAASIFLSNFHFWKDSGYFSASALTRPLLHTWSLSVEEQYYIFAPVMTFIVYKYLGKKWLLIYAPIIAISLISSIIATKIAPTANFFLLPTRTWELLLGALLAHKSWPPIKSRATNEILAILGLSMIAYAVMTYDEATPFPGLNAIFPCLGSAILLYVGRSENIISKILSIKPMVGIGQLSYSLYLVHWPVIVFAYVLTLNHPTLTQLPILLAITFGLSILSFKFVEQPFRKISTEQHRNKFLIAGVVTIAALSALGGFGLANKGFPDRFPNYKVVKIDGNNYWNRGTCFLENNTHFSRWQKDKCMITQDNKPKALLWGDSFAAQYVPGITQKAAEIPYSIYQYTSAGCPPVLSYQSLARPNCTTFNENALTLIREENIQTVILAGRWTDLESRGLSELKTTLNALDEMGIKTFIIGQSPQFAIDVQIIAFSKGDPNQKSIDEWNVFFDPTINDELMHITQGHSFINPMTSWCSSKTLCPYRENETFLFEDYGHFSTDGSKKAAEQFLIKAISR